MLRHLADADFCSPEHRQKYHELTRMALNRLVETREQLAAAPKRKRLRPGVAVEEALTPTPPVAELVGEQVAALAVRGHSSFYGEFAWPDQAVQLPETSMPGFVPAFAEGLLRAWQIPGPFWEPGRMEDARGAIFLRTGPGSVELGRYGGPRAPVLSPYLPMPRIAALAVSGPADGDGGAAEYFETHPTAHGLRLPSLVFVPAAGPSPTDVFFGIPARLLREPAEAAPDAVNEAALPSEVSLFTSTSAWEPRPTGYQALISRFVAPPPPSEWVAMPLPEACPPAHLGAILVEAEPGAFAVAPPQRPETRVPGGLPAAPVLAAGSLDPTEAPAGAWAGAGAAFLAGGLSLPRLEFAPAARVAEGGTAGFDSAALSRERGTWTQAAEWSATEAAGPAGLEQAAARRLATVGFEADRAEPATLPSPGEVIPLAPPMPRPPVAALPAPSAPALTHAGAAGTLEVPRPALPDVAFAPTVQLAAGSGVAYETGAVGRAEAAPAAGAGWSVSGVSWDITFRHSRVWRLRPVGFELARVVVPPARTEPLALPAPEAFEVGASTRAASSSELRPHAAELPRAAPPAGRTELGAASLLAAEALPAMTRNELRVTRAAPSPAFPIGQPLYLGWAAVRLPGTLGSAAPQALGLAETPADRVRLFARGFEQLRFAPPPPLPWLPSRTGMVELRLDAAAPSPPAETQAAFGSMFFQPAREAPFQPAATVRTTPRMVAVAPQFPAQVQLAEAPTWEAYPPELRELAHATEPLGWAAGTGIPATVRLPATGVRSPLGLVVTAREGSLGTGQQLPVELSAGQAAVVPVPAGPIPAVVSAVQPAPLPGVAAAARLTTGPAAEVSPRPAERGGSPSVRDWAVPRQVAQGGGVQSRLPSVGTILQPHQALAGPGVRNPLTAPQPVAPSAFGRHPVTQPLGPGPSAFLLLGSTPYVLLPPAAAHRPAARPPEPVRLLFPPAGTRTAGSEPVFRVTGNRRLSLGEAAPLALEAAGGTAGQPRWLRAELASRSPRLRGDPRVDRLRAPVLEGSHTPLGLGSPAARTAAPASRHALGIGFAVEVRTGYRAWWVRETCTLSTGPEILLPAPEHGHPRQAAGAHLSHAPVTMAEPARVPAPPQLAAPVLEPASWVLAGRSLAVAAREAALGSTQARGWEALGHAYGTYGTVRSQITAVRWRSAGHCLAEAPPARRGAKTTPRETVAAMARPPAMEPRASGIARCGPLCSAPAAPRGLPAQQDSAPARSLRRETSVATEAPVRTTLPRGLAAARTGGLQVAPPSLQEGRSEDVRTALRQPAAIRPALSQLAMPTEAFPTGCAYDLFSPWPAPVEPLARDNPYGAYTEPRVAPIQPQIQLQARPCAPVPHRFERLSFAPVFGRGFSLARLWRSIPRAVTVPAATLVAVLVLGFIFWNTGAAASLHDSVRQRAAVVLEEDFSSGLARWTDGASGWSRDAGGSVHVGGLALLAPSLRMKDYRVEFMGVIERQSLSWVFRAQDPQNYYAMKIAVVKPGPLPTMGLVRYEVIGGKEGQRVQMPLRIMLHNNAPFRVRVAVSGSDFTTLINGQLVDFWGDDRLKAGGAGFFSEPGDRARLYWVKIAHQDDMLGKLCSYLAPNNLDSRNGSSK